MSLFLDQNLSYKVQKAIDKVFPGTKHVRDKSLETSSDDEIWEFAKANKLAIVTKDADFWERSVLLGSPPKVVWIKQGNCSTKSIIDLLISSSQNIQDFLLDDSVSILTLY